MTVKRRGTARIHPACQVCKIHNSAHLPVFRIQEHHDSFNCALTALQDGYADNRGGTV